MHVNMYYTVICMCCIIHCKYMYIKSYTCYKCALLMKLSYYKYHDKLFNRFTLPYCRCYFYTNGNNITIMIMSQTLRSLIVINERVMCVWCSVPITLPHNNRCNELLR